MITKILSLKKKRDHSQSALRNTCIAKIIPMMGTCMISSQDKEQDRDVSNLFY